MGSTDHRTLDYYDMSIKQEGLCMIMRKEWLGTSPGCINNSLTAWVYNVAMVTRVHKSYVPHVWFFPLERIHLF